jgi:hypothetical protein
MYKIELPRLLNECPSWWITLRDNHQPMEASVAIITNNYGTIHYKDENTVDYIEFPSEAHFHWFLLHV